jgi:hypothetical protein
VWTPGYWRWNGRDHVWIAGTWQIPPSAQHRWQAPGFTVNGAGVAVPIPGGWVIVR